MKDALKVTLGSIVVYYVMAACSAPAGSSAPGTSNGATSGGSSSGVSASGGSSSAGGFGAPSSSSGAGTSNGSVGSSNGSSGTGSPVRDANADEPQSGSRLKANYYMGGDGSKQFAFFADSQRNGEQCTFGLASDGSTRCLPSGAEMGSYYADAGCSVPLALAVCATAPAYGVSYGNGSCGLGQRTIYPVTGAFGGSTFYSGTPSACTALTSADLPASYVLYAVGSPVPPSSFQIATIAVQ